MLDVVQGACAEEHGHEVESAGSVPEFVLGEVELGCALEPRTFLSGQAIGWCGQRAFGAGFDFHEDDGVALFADEVEFEPAQAQVAFQDAQALVREEFRGGFLALAA